MDSFNGTWVYLNSVTTTITEKNNLLTVAASAGRGPFKGFEVDAVNPVITIDYTDDAVITGVLSQDGTTIYWNNGTVWKKS